MGIPKQIAGNWHTFTEQHQGAVGLVALPGTSQISKLLTF